MPLLKSVRVRQTARRFRTKPIRRALYLVPRLPEKERELPQETLHTIPFSDLEDPPHDICDFYADQYMID